MIILIQIILILIFIISLDKLYQKFIKKNFFLFLSYYIFISKIINRFNYIINVRKNVFHKSFFF